MFTFVLFILLWIVILVYAASTLLTLNNLGKFRDMALDLDAGTLASFPYQPEIAVIVRCNLSRPGAEERLEGLLGLRYIRYEIILLADERADPGAFARVVEKYGLKKDPVSPFGEEGKVFSGTQGPYRHMVLADYPSRCPDRVKTVGMELSSAGQFVWLESLNDILSPESLTEMSLVEMRDPEERIGKVRSAARYRYFHTIRGNVYRMMSDLCNLRRVYLGGTLRRNNFGRYVVLEKKNTAGKTEEFMPRPQLWLTRRNHLKTYLLQLAPRFENLSFRGKGFAVLELLLSLIFWGAAFRVLLFRESMDQGELMILSVLLLILVCSTFSIWVAEVVVRREYRPGVVWRLLLVSLLECLLFCLLTPPAWLLRLRQK